jgi:hypothetical protein
VVWTEAAVKFRAAAGIECKWLYQVMPDIRRLPIQGNGDSLEAGLGALQVSKVTRCLLRIGLPQATASTVAVGEIEVSYTASSGQREGTGFVPWVLPVQPWQYPLPPRVGSTSRLRPGTTQRNAWPQAALEKKAQLCVRCAPGAQLGT